MSKTLAVIKIHSVMGVVTNSSSEIFVSTKNLSVEAVKEILTKLLVENYADLVGSGEVYNCQKDFNFEAMFGAIYVLNDDTFPEFIENVVIDYGAIPKGIDAPRPPDYMEVTRPFGYKFPWDEHEKYNREMQVAQKNAWEAAKMAWRAEHEHKVRAALHGAVCVESATDNSIPYGIWDLICSKLNAYHVHLG